MPSKISTWPSGWPSFTPKDNDPTDTYQADLKKRIINDYGAGAIMQSWVKTCTALDPITSKISSLGTGSVPIFEYSEVISDTNPEALQKIKEVGCCIIRNVIPTSEASQHFSDLTSFIAANKDTVTGWPAKSPAIFHLYSSPVQLKLRTHTRQLKLQRLLNSLFTDASASGEDHSEPISYPDALRVRAPGQEFLGLGPHIDSGSLSRWADVHYLKTYDAIFKGLPEEYDPFDLQHRKNAKPGMFPGGAQCSVLRGFQGWTALTPCAPGEGGLMLVPDIKVVTAYMMLRPFVKPPKDADDWRDASKWEIDDETAWFPGTYRWDSQLLSPASHPHLYLEDTLVSLPEVQPGDTIWWHADMCHAVETHHNGRYPASVVYIPAVPSTESNKAYIRQHWKDLLAGIPPDDYKYLDGTGKDLVLSKQNERKMIGALPIETLSAEGRRALGEAR